MATEDIVVVGASAGGVEALRELVSHLAEDYRGSVFVVLHVAPDAPTVLPNILNRAGPLPASIARNGERIEPGRIYVGPPDHHLMVAEGRVQVTSGPRENRHRPSIDVLFRSAARAYGPRVTAVLLSGMRDDGVSGLHAVKRLGGTVLIQKPADAGFPELPATGIAFDSPDRVLPAAEIAAELVRRAGRSAGDRTPTPMDLEKEVRYAAGGAGPRDIPPGRPAEYACPECNGAMWTLEEKDLVRFRCRVGHAYTEESLISAKSEALESALWAALRALEESAAIERRAAKRAGTVSTGSAAARLMESAETKARQAELLRDILLGVPSQSKTGTDG